jgi:2-succinyl-6-hydroxy-2,4-cyclohexadiene-1-carboxylate synthase
MICLHGFLGCGADFAYLAEQFPGRRIVAFDLPGHGREPALFAPDYTFEDVVLSLRDAILALGLDTPTLLAYSMGGRLAYGLLTREDAPPFGSATLIGAHPGLPEEQTGERNDADEALAGRLAGLGFDCEAFLSEWYEQSLFKGIETLPGYEAMLDRRRQGDPRGWAAALRTFGLSEQPDFRFQLNRIETPLFLIAGALDEKYVALNEEVASLRPGTETVVVPGVGHAAHMAAPRP